MIGLDEAFERACREPSDIVEHLPFFAEIAAQSTTIIELGTRSGVSTLAWLHGLPEGGHLWSVDIDPAPELPDPGNWTFVQGNDLDPATLAQLPTVADVVFIDTSHEYRQTLAELRTYRWRVRPGGMILLHDTEVPRPFGIPVDPARIYPVRGAIEQFCTEERLSWENRPNCFGLGIIDIPEG